MIERIDPEKRPNLRKFPSAEAQESLPIKGRSASPPRKPKSGWFKFCLKSSAVLAIALILISGAALFVLSKRAVSIEQLRAGIESQLTNLLGENRSAKIGDAKIALGQGGLLAIDASDVRILQDSSISLGAVNEISVKLKALPLFSGQVVAKSLAINDASISVDNLIKLDPVKTAGVTSQLRPFWPRSVNLDLAMRQLGNVFRQVAGSLERAGLESIELNGTELIGFEQFGLRSKTASFSTFNVRKSDGNNNGIRFDAILNTQLNDWSLSGEWRKLEEGVDVLILTAEGLELQDLISGLGTGERRTVLSNPVTLRLEVPYLEDGTPQQATLKAEFLDGEMVLAGKHVADAASGNLNLRLLPGKNQIDLERSNVEVDGYSARLTGGFRYPSVDDDPISTTPVFQISVEEFDAFGLIHDGQSPKGKMSVEGMLDPLNQTLSFTKVDVETPAGSATGSASWRLDTVEPYIKINFLIPEMPVDELKQFWPAFIAPNTRRWIDKNVWNGQVSDARLSADFPPGRIRQHALYNEDNLSIDLKIRNATFRCVGKLPNLSRANGNVRLKGNETVAQIDTAVLKQRGRNDVQVRNSSFKLGPFSDRPLNGRLALDLSGEAGSLGALTALEPLNLAKKINIDLQGLTGNGSAQIDADLLFNKKRVFMGPNQWSAKVKLRESGFKKPVSGRSISNLDVIIDAGPLAAEINGNALVDGIPAELAMVQPLKDKGTGASSISLVLDEKGLRKFGIDTAGVIEGPIKVKLVQTKKGEQAVEADLKSATLNLPWIGWSKGKGIAANAKFVLSENKGVRRLKNLELRGKGFSANGNLTLSKTGLDAARFSNVKLNKTDDFDIDLNRTTKGYDVTVDARSYDARALIRSFLNNGKRESGGKAEVRLSGRVKKLTGFSGQSLFNVNLDFAQKGSRVGSATVKALASGNSPTLFSLQPVNGGMRTKISTGNAGSVLRFLNLYEKIRGGSIDATLVRDKSNVFRGVVQANNFELLGEPRLAQLLQKPTVPKSIRYNERVQTQLRQIRTDQVTVDQLQARIEKGAGFLNIKKGRLGGGDASAAFEGVVYDANNQMNISGTYLPGRSLNRLASRIPIIGLAFGKGKVDGLFGITFRLKGRYGNPKLLVNPLSIIAPGVFRRLFNF